MAPINEEFISDQELMQELNERYRDDWPDPGAEAARRRKRLLVRLGALAVALLFALTLLGSSLRVFTFPTLYFLQESWELGRDPLVRELRQAVTLIEAAHPAGNPLSPGKALRGTGFNIHPSGLVITNRHLVEGAGSVTVSFAGHGRHRAAAWYWSGTADMAAIVLEETTGLPVVALDGPARLRQGQPVTIIGNPLELSRVSLRGQVSSIGPYRGYAHPVAVIAAQIYPGHSGSPVFTGEGKVAGIVFASVTRGNTNERLGLAVPVDQIHDFLAVTGKGASPVSP